MHCEVREMQYVRPKPSEATSGMQEREEKRSARILVSVTWCLLLSFVSGLLHSFMGVIVKQIPNIHPAQLVCYRFCIVASITLPEAVWHNQNLLGPPGSRLFIILRGAATGTVIVLQFIAYRHLPVGVAAVIISSYPAFVSIAGKIFLKEPFGFLQGLSVVFTIIGMIFVTGTYERIIHNFPVDTEDNTYGLAAGLASVFFMTLQIILTRKVKNVHHSVLLLGSVLPANIGCIVIVAAVDKFRLLYSGLQQFLVIIMGILAYCTKTTSIVATQNMNAGPVSTMGAASEIIFSFVWQVIISHDIPNGMRIIGAVLISCSIILIGFNKQINEGLSKGSPNSFNHFVTYSKQ